MLREFQKGIFNKPLISWTKLSRSLHSSPLPPQHVLEKGRSIHQYIQNILASKYGAYTELSPIVYYQPLDVLLIGHFDMLNIEDKEHTIYEIKSNYFFRRNAELVMLQGAYYNLLLECLQKQMQSEDIETKTVLILYETPKTDEYSLKDLKLEFMNLHVKPYIRRIEDLLKTYVGV